MNSIKDIIKQVHEITHTQINQRLEPPVGEESITELAHAINEMLSRLELGFEQQNEFIANASHELRTPLTVVTGQIEVALLKERSKDEYKQALISILEDIKNLNRLTHHLMTLLRADTLTADSSYKINRIDEILWKARSEYLKRNPKHQVEIFFDATIQDENHFKLLSNHDLLKTAFVNLIDNGCKYSADKRVEIHLAIHENQLRLKFCDHGIGIPSNEIDKITQPFYRATNIKNNHGHGIGLALVKKIVEVHEGQIQFVTSVNEGTEVILSFIS